MPPNTTDLKICVEAPKGCGETLLSHDVKSEEEPVIFRHEKPSFRTSLPQVLATMAQSMLLLALGMLVCAPTVVIGALNRKDSSEPIKLSNSQASWFAGILLIMQPTGSVLSGIVQDLVGRKRCMLLVNLPQLGGWILVWYASSAEHLFLAAVLMGFSIGFMEAPTLSYVGEIAQPHLRGILASFTSVYISTGMLVMYLMATFTDWRTSAALSTAVPVLTVIAISLVPESPVWLLLKGRDKEAEASLRWLRGWTSSDNVAKEFANLKDHVHSSRLVYRRVSGQSKDGESRKPTMKEKLQDLSRPAILKPLTLTVLFFGFAHAAALNGARPYLYKVYKTLGVPVDPFVATVCAAVTQIVGSFFCMGTVRRIGKRRLSLISMAACSTICLLLGVYTLLYQEGKIHISWLPLLLMAALTFSTNAGIGVIPWTLLSEVFPARGRGIGGGISAALYYFWFFFVTKTWLDLESVINLYGMFFFYSTLGFVGFCFLYLCLPETEGKTLDEIEHIFKKKWFRR